MAERNGFGRLKELQEAMEQTVAVGPAVAEQQVEQSVLLAEGQL